MTTVLQRLPRDAHRHAGAHVHRRAAHGVRHHARPFGEVNKRDGIRLIVVERRGRPVVDDTACTVARPDASRC